MTLSTSSDGGGAAQPASNRALIKRLVRRYLARYKTKIGLGVVCMVLVAGTTAANAWLMEPVLNEVFLNRNLTLLMVLPAVVVALAAVKALATFGESYLIKGAAVRVSGDIQNELYAHLMRADLKFFHGTASGKLISSFLTDAMQLRRATGKALIGLVKDSLTLLFLIGVMFEKDWRLALVALVVLPLASFPLRRTGRRMRKSSRQVQERSGSLAAHLDTTFDGAREVKAYGMEAFETERATAAIHSRQQAMLTSLRIQAAASPTMELLAGIAIALVIWYGGSRVIEGITTPGAFFAFIVALLLSYQPLKALANLNAGLQTGLAAAQRLFAALDRMPEIEDRPGAVPLVVDGGEVTFDAVGFAYRPETPALDRVAFTVPAGRTVALVGPSGAGKSTILNLILRFFDVDRGRVLIDRIDVRDVTLASLRQAIGLVAQDATLFDDTVRANIAYGRADATDAEIAAAAEAAGADGFIAALPQGYDTEVGSRGVKLSGGQRQRVAIARAILKNAPILLLDEATSALDSESERAVQAALTRLMEGRTTLVVAHRLSTVLHADQILVIDGGQIVETGRHAELIARDGLYARLHATQFGAPALAEPAPGERRVRAGG